MLHVTRLRRAGSLLVAVSAALMTTVAAVPAHAIEPIVSDPLATPSVSAFVVDGAHGHLLFGSGSAQNGVLITDLAGTTVSTIQTGGGIDDISVTPDGQYAFAVSGSLRQVDEINLSSLTVVGSPFTLPAGDTPTSVAAVSDTVAAVGYNASLGGIGVLTTTTSTFNVLTKAYDYDVIVRRVPSTTEVVLAARDDSMAYAAVVQTSSGSPVLVNDTSSLPYGLGNCEYLNDMAISPDGTQMLTACGGEDTILRQYRLSDFTATASYPAGTPVTAAAYSPVGGYVGAGMDGDYDVDLAVFNSDTSLLYSLDYGEDDSGDVGPSTAPGGVAFSADGSQFYTLASNDPDDPGQVWLVTLPATSVPTFPPPTPAPPTGPIATAPEPPAASPPIQVSIRQQSAATDTVGRPLKVTGTLSFSNGLSPAGLRISVAASLDGVPMPLVTAPVAADGSFSYTVVPAKVGTLSVVASYAGAIGLPSSSGTLQVNVGRGAARVVLKVAHLHGKVYVVKATLTTFGANRKLTIEANSDVIARGVVNKAGLFSIRFTRKHSTPFLVIFTGDANDYPAHASVTLH